MHYSYYKPPQSQKTWHQFKEIETALSRNELPVLRFMNSLKSETQYMNRLSQHFGNAVKIVSLSDKSVSPFNLLTPSSDPIIVLEMMNLSRTEKASNFYNIVAKYQATDTSHKPLVAIVDEIDVHAFNVDLPHPDLPKISYASDRNWPLFKDIHSYTATGIPVLLSNVDTTFCSLVDQISPHYRGIDSLEWGSMTLDELLEIREARSSRFLDELLRTRLEETSSGVLITTNPLSNPEGKKRTQWNQFQYYSAQYPSWCHLIINSYCIEARLSGRRGQVFFEDESIESIYECLTKEWGETHIVTYTYKIAGRANSFCNASRDWTNHDHIALYSDGTTGDALIQAQRLCNTAVQWGRRGRVWTTRSLWEDIQNHYRYNAQMFEQAVASNQLPHDLKINKLKQILTDSKRPPVSRLKLNQLQWSKGAKSNWDACDVDATLLSFVVYDDQPASEKYQRIWRGGKGESLVTTAEAKRLKQLALTQNPQVRSLIQSKQAIGQTGISVSLIAHGRNHGSLFTVNPDSPYHNRVFHFSYDEQDNRAMAIVKFHTPDQLKQLIAQSKPLKVHSDDGTQRLVSSEYHIV